MDQVEQIRQEQQAQAAAPRKPYQGLIQSVSNILHPLLTLTLIALVICFFTPVQVLPYRFKAFFVGIVMLHTLLLPVIIITLMHVFHIVGHWALRDRRDRMLPFLTNFVCYTINAIVLTRLHYFPMWLLMAYYGSAILTFVAWIVSFWWKISAHASANAAGATYCLMLYFFFPELMPIWIGMVYIFLCGVVCSTRVYLGRHTFGQVGAGSLLGVLSIFGAYLYFLN